MRNRLYLTVLLCAGVVVLWLAHGWMKAPFMTNDGYQYLDAAASLLSDGCFCTHMAHFDEQVAYGRMPVPFTHFPPGYPLLIAGLSLLRVPPATAGYLISAIGFLLTVWLIWYTGLLLNGLPWLTFIFTALWIAQEGAIVYSSMLLTESIFTAVIIAMVALIVRDLKAEGKHPALLPCIGGLAGAAYSFRYAGLFLIPPVLLYICWRWWRNRETLPWALGGVLAACAFLVPIQLWNILSMGYWRGVVFVKMPDAFMQTWVGTLQASYVLVLGGHLLFPFVIWEGLLPLAVLAVTWLAFRAWRRGAWANPGEFFPRAVGWIAFIGAVYVTGIFITGVTTASQDPVRYNLPIYPLVLACLAGATSRIRLKGWRPMAGLIAVAVLAVNIFALSIRPNPPLHVFIAQFLKEEVHPGESLQHWLLDRIPPKAILVAQEGQALYYVLHRPVIAMLEPPVFSQRFYDSGSFLDMMSHYKSRYLVLFPTIRGPRNSLPFLYRLASGETHDWLKLTVRTPDVAVYECDLCAR